MTISEKYRNELIKRTPIEERRDVVEKMMNNAVSEQLYGTTENKEKAVSEKEKEILRALGEAVVIYAIVAIVFVVLFNWVIMLNLIPSGSMESTLMNVPIENFVGKARVILFPFDRIGTLDWEGGR